MALLQTKDFDDSQEDLLFIEKVGVSEDNLLTSRTGYETDTRIGRLKRLGLSPVVTGAVWAAGIEFTAYDQYLVYNEFVYVLNRSVAVPVETGATPDSNFVILESITDAQNQNNYDKYNQERLHKFTNLDFNSVSEMQSLTTISGNVVDVIVGSMLTVSDESTDSKTAFVVIDFADIEPGDTTFLLSNSLYAKQVDYSLDPSLTSPIRNLSTIYDNLDVRGPSLNYFGDTDQNGVLNQYYMCIGQDGLIYYPDVNFTSAPVIVGYNSKTKSKKYISLVGASGTPAPYNWVLGSDGNIYIPPANTTLTEYVVVVNTKDMTFSELEVTHSLGGKSYQYGGGVLTSNGTAYWFPQESSGEMGILKVDTNIGFIDSYVDNETVYGGGRFGQACIEPNGNIILCPATGTSFLYIDVSNDSVNSFGTLPSGSGIGSFSNILVGSDGFVYAIPYQYANIVKIDPGSYTVVDYTYITPPAGVSISPSITGSSIGPNGLLYCSHTGNDSIFIEVNLQDQTFNQYTFLDDNMPGFGVPFGNAQSMRVDKYGVIVCIGSSKLAEITNLNDEQSWTKSAYVQ